MAPRFSGPIPPHLSILPLITLQRYACAIFLGRNIRTSFLLSALAESQMTPFSTLKRHIESSPRKGRDSGRSDFDGARRRPPLQQLRSCATLCRIGTGQSHCYFCRSEWFNENDARWRLGEQQVKKSVYFDVFDRPGWPSPDELRHYFLAPPGQRWTFVDGESASWGLDAEGVDGTEHL